MFGLGMQELVVIFLIILVLFGGSKLPEIARGIGRAINELKNAGKEVSTYKNDQENEEGKDRKSVKTKEGNKDKA